MCSANQVHVVLLEEAGNHVGSECEGDAAVIFAPTRNVLVRVRPEQVAQETTVRDLELSAKLTCIAKAGNLLQSTLARLDVHQWDA